MVSRVLFSDPVKPEKVQWAGFNCANPGSFPPGPIPADGPNCARGKKIGPAAQPHSTAGGCNDYCTRSLPPSAGHEPRGREGDVREVRSELSWHPWAGQKILSLRRRSDWRRRLSLEH